jgi:hypothetical protein
MNCQKCPQYKSCTKPCDKVNKILKDSGIYSQDYIRPFMPSMQRIKERKKGIYLSKYREIPFSALKIRSKDGEKQEYDTSN